jgi:hypothetical protein
MRTVDRTFVHWIRVRPSSPQVALSASQIIHLTDTTIGHAVQTDLTCECLGQSNLLAFLLDIFLAMNITTKMSR